MTARLERASRMLDSGQTLSAAIDGAVLAALAEDPRGLILVPLPAKPGPRHTVRLTAPDHLEAWTARLGSERVLRLRYQPDSLLHIAMGARRSGIPVVLDLTAVRRPHGLLAGLCSGDCERDGAPFLIRLARRSGDAAADALALAAAQSGAADVALPAFPSDGIALTAHAFEMGMAMVMLEDGSGQRRTAELAASLPAPVDGVKHLSTGTSLTVVAFGGLAHAAQSAAARLHQTDGLSCAVFAPLRLGAPDWTPITDSVADTGRLLILDGVAGPLASHVAAHVACSNPKDLLAPVTIQAVAEPGPDPALSLLPLLQQAAWAH